MSRLMLGWRWCRFGIETGFLLIAVFDDLIFVEIVMVIIWIAPVGFVIARKVHWSVFSCYVLFPSLFTSLLVFCRLRAYGYCMLHHAQARCFKPIKCAVPQSTSLPTLKPGEHNLT